MIRIKKALIPSDLRGGEISPSPWKICYSINDFLNLVKEIFKTWLISVIITNIRYVLILIVKSFRPY